MRKIFGKASKEEMDSFNLIRTKISCARQAMSIVPNGTEAEQKFYYQSMLDSFSNYTWLEQDWWTSVLEKYGLDKSAKLAIDFSSLEFYLDE